MLGLLVMVVTRMVISTSFASGALVMLEQLLGREIKAVVTAQFEQIKTADKCYYKKAL